MKLTPSLSAMMVLLADQPAILASEIKAMLEQHARRPGRILAAHYTGHLGPPCIFPTGTLEELAALAGPDGARGVLRRHAALVDSYPLPSAAFDIDTPADHAAWLAKQRLMTPDEDS